MRFDGEWLDCDDGITRPVIRAEILTASGNWRAIELLVDTCADRRDILDMFAVIVDRRGVVIAIVGGQHRYTIDRS